MTLPGGSCETLGSLNLFLDAKPKANFSITKASMPRAVRVPHRDKVIVENVPVDVDRCVGLRVNSIGLLAQLVLYVVVS